MAEFGAARYAGGFFANARPWLLRRTITEPAAVAVDGQNATTDDAVPQQQDQRQRQLHEGIWSLKGGVFTLASIAAACVHSLTRTRSLLEWSRSLENLILLWGFLLALCYVGLEVLAALFVGNLRVFERNRVKEKLLEKSMQAAMLVVAVSLDLREALYWMLWLTPPAFMAASLRLMKDRLHNPLPTETASGCDGSFSSLLHSACLLAAAFIWSSLGGGIFFYDSHVKIKLILLYEMLALALGCIEVQLSLAASPSHHLHWSAAVVASQLARMATGVFLLVQQFFVWQHGASGVVHAADLLLFMRIKSAFSIIIQAAHALRNHLLVCRTLGSVVADVDADEDDSDSDFDGAFEYSATSPQESSSRNNERAEAGGAAMGEVQHRLFDGGPAAAAASAAESASNSSIRGVESRPGNAGGAGSGGRGAGRLFCVICREPRRHGEDFKKLSCNHSFHFGCLQQWLTASSSIICPICRAPALPQSADSSMRRRVASSTSSSTSVAASTTSSSSSGTSSTGAINNNAAARGPEASAVCDTMQQQSSSRLAADMSAAPATAVDSAASTGERCNNSAKSVSPEAPAAVGADGVRRDVQQGACVVDSESTLASARSCGSSSSNNIREDSAAPLTAFPQGSSQLQQQQQSRLPNNDGAAPSSTIPCRMGQHDHGVAVVSSSTTPETESTAAAGPAIPSVARNAPATPSRRRVPSFGDTSALQRGGSSGTAAAASLIAAAAAAADAAVAGRRGPSRDEGTTEPFSDIDGDDFDEEPYTPMVVVLALPSADPQTVAAAAEVFASFSQLATAEGTVRPGASVEPRTAAARTGAEVSGLPGTLAAAGIRSAADNMAVVHGRETEVVTDTHTETNDTSENSHVAVTSVSAEEAGLLAADPVVVAAMQWGATQATALHLTPVAAFHVEMPEVFMELASVQLPGLLGRLLERVARYLLNFTGIRAFPLPLIPRNTQPPVTPAAASPFGASNFVATTAPPSAAEIGVSGAAAPARSAGAAPTSSAGDACTASADASSTDAVDNTAVAPAFNPASAVSAPAGAAAAASSSIHISANAEKTAPINAATQQLHQQAQKFQHAQQTSIEQRAAPQQQHQPLDFAAQSQKRLLSQAEEQAQGAQQTKFSEDQNVQRRPSVQYSNEVSLMEQQQQQKNEREAMAKEEECGRRTETTVKSTDTRENSSSAGCENLCSNDGDGELTDDGN